MRSPSFSVHGARHVELLIDDENELLRIEIFDSIGEDEPEAAHVTVFFDGPVSVKVRS